mmetsp:Transcript_71499/g.125106  ORF Transcript_71499/g.125106 Transcript_71499/m.125106 type:complete len:420 (-) Transcript_71499:14-1273(-)
MGEASATAGVAVELAASQGDVDEVALAKILEENPHCKQLSASLARPFLNASLLPRALHDEDRFMSPSWPKMVYTKRPDAERSSCHWGQLKLFESELKCLTDFGLAASTEGARHASPAPSGEQGTLGEQDLTATTDEQLVGRANGDLDKMPVILYVGAAPGRHVPALAKRFPTCRFELYDPANFDQRLRDFAESDEAGGRVTIVQDFFDDSRAQQICARRHSAPLVFVCDIRTADPLQMGGGEVEEFIERDMARQRAWVEALRPDVSLLKFRLPWGPGRTQYLSGRVLVQAFPPCTSTETRLLVSRKDVDVADTTYDHEIYEQQLMYHNTIKRAQLHDVGVPSSGVGAVVGLDKCFDCAAVAATVRSYLAARNGTTPDRVLDHHVGQEISAIIAEISESGRTLATPYHVSSSRHGGGGLS